MRYSKFTLANTLALTVGILWAICAIFIVLLPNLSLQITGWWLHGLNIGALGPWNMTISSFLLGGVLLVVSAWVSGFTFGWALSLFGKKSN